jgi:hypothetical protein
MPYTFTSWTACTDPAANARTLDWSLAAMVGQPAGLYLEALRQAAALRHSVHAAGGVTDPGGLLMQPALVQADKLLNFIDGVAWDYAPDDTAGWIVSTYEPLDFSGSGSRPAVMASVADILTATGHAARIACPVTPHGMVGLSAEYLRQLYDVLRAKIRYGKQLALGSSKYCALGTIGWAYAKSVFESYSFPTNWYDTFTGTLNSYVSQASSPNYVTIRRTASEITWAAPNGVQCSKADTYLYAVKAGTWEETDYGFSAENTWQRLDDNRDIGTGITEWVGNIQTVTASEPTADTGNHGYVITAGYVLSDFSTDWVLGA